MVANPSRLPVSEFPLATSRPRLPVNHTTPVLAALFAHAIHVVLEAPFSIVIQAHTSDIRIEQLPTLDTPGMDLLICVRTPH